MAIQLTNSTATHADQIEVQRICDCIYKLRSLALDFYEYTYVKTLALYQCSGRAPEQDNSSRKMPIPFRSETIDQSKPYRCLPRARALSPTHEFNVAFCGHLFHQVQSIARSDSDHESHFSECRTANLLSKCRLQRACRKDSLGTLPIEIYRRIHLDVAQSIIGTEHSFEILVITFFSL